MSFTFALNSANDLTITSAGTFKLVTGADEVKQRIITTLQHEWDEYFLNRPSGVPWYQLILGNKDRRMVEILLRREILKVPGVIGIILFEATSIGRALQIKCMCLVSGGQTVSFTSNFGG